MNVQELMTRTVFTCREGDPMSAAAQLMWEHDIGALPVLGADDKLVGIVTDRDLCMAAYFTGEPLGAVPVAHAMSKVVFTVEPGQSLDVIENLMRSRQLHRVPVVDAGKLVGMLSLGDLARAARTRRQVSALEVSATCAAIAEPRPAPAA